MSKEITRFAIADGRVFQIGVGEEDWVVVNPTGASRAQSVCVINVRNAPKEMPMFVYFVAGKEVCNLRRDPDLDAIDQAIIDVWPEYEAVIRQRVEPVFSESGRLVNADVWANSPEPGYFDPSAMPEYWAVDVDE